MLESREYHADYCITLGEDRWNCVYEGGQIAKTVLTRSADPDSICGTIRLFFRDGSLASWELRHSLAYLLQFGISVSADGDCVFIQTWDQGLFCYDARTGEQRWRTKSKRGVTNLFVCGPTLLCQQHGRALLMLDSKTGEVLKERRVTSWGFTALSHRYILCEIHSGKWEILDAASMETLRSFSQRDYETELARARAELLPGTL